MDYTEAFVQYLAGSIDWLNEGHLPAHNRDGPLVLVWSRDATRQRARRGEQALVLGELVGALRPATRVGLAGRLRRGGPGE